MDSSISTLRTLANIITQAVDTMEQVYSEAGMPLPSLDQPFHRDDPAESLRRNIEVSGAVKNIIAAAAQLTATHYCKSVITVTQQMQFQVSACFGAASELNIVDILREAGPQGAHVKEIAAPSKNDPELIARILRLLATHHIFREVSHGTFANNRISSSLATGKSVKVLFDSPEERLTGTSGIAALVEMLADGALKTGAFLADSLQCPEEQKLPHNLAQKTDEPLFKVMQRPENRSKLRRFAVAMQGTAASDPPELILQGFDWGALPSGGVVVDVGGGIGHASLAIAQKHPGLHIINQDLGPAIELSKTHWGKHLPTHVENKLIDFQVHDFFTAQPVKDADVFLLRHILHDWGNTKAASILQCLRDAATPSTKLCKWVGKSWPVRTIEFRLVLVEKIVRIVSSDEPGSEIPGADRPRAPGPLLPNWGCASADTYFFDIMMHNSFGGIERTLEGFVDILKMSGWKLVQVHHCTPSPLSHLIAVPW
ncbi:O-methyltransferase [Mycena haematopus]|nr:O-methyltransferase [Mycena haematopus]